MVPEEKTFIEKIPVWIRWVLIIPTYILFIFIGRKLLDLFWSWIYYDNLSSGENQWNGHIFRYDNFDTFLNNWWNIAASEFIVIWASLTLSLGLLSDEKKKIGFWILSIVQVLITLSLFIILPVSMEITTIFRSLTILGSYFLSFLIYYKKELV